MIDSAEFLGVHAGPILLQFSVCGPNIAASKHANLKPLEVKRWNKRPGLGRI